MKKTGLYLIICFLMLSCKNQEADTSNAIVVENRLPGSSACLIQVPDDTCSYPNHQFCRRPEIEGYCSRMSLSKGDSISFFVSTSPATQYTVDIYRMGYYQGLGGNLKLKIGPMEGEIQADPEPDSLSNFFECHWNGSYKMIIPPDWLSGVYLCKLTTIPDSNQSYIIFIVTDDRQADFLFQCSDLTWQSYNRWPYWHSLYEEAHQPWRGA